MEPPFEQEIRVKQTSAVAKIGIKLTFLFCASITPPMQLFVSVNYCLRINFFVNKPLLLLLLFEEIVL